MVTSKKIAEIAGVSRGTVDRALNNRDDVNPATRQKILEIAALLQYKPNKAGKILVSHQKKIKIGCIIMENTANFFVGDLCRGIMLKAQEYSSYGIEVILEKAGFQSALQCAAIDMLVEKGINALMLQPVNESPVVEKLRSLDKLGIPVVTADTNIDGFTPLCHVGINAFIGGKTAANLLDLLTGGSCNIGILTGYYNASSHNERIEGFKDYIKDCESMKIVSILENRDDETEAFRVICRLLEDHPEVNALFLVASGVHGTGKALKTIPNYHRIKVVSYDDVPTTRGMILDGTVHATICQQPVRQGIMAMEVLFEYLFDKKRPVLSRLYTDIQIKVKANINFQESLVYRQ